MQCPICWANTIGFIGTDCRCGSKISIGDLFSAGEQGAWYDPSDLSTMFQDSAGTTPVTGPGDPVGLILDRSRESDQPVTHTAPDWQSDPIDPDGTGVVRYFNAIPPGTLLVGGWYSVSIDVEEYQGSGTVGVGGSSFDSVLAASRSRQENGKIYFIGRSSSGGVQLFSRDTNSCVLSHISVREIPGNHAIQSVSAARPTYQSADGLHWLEFDGIDDEIVAALPALSDSSTVGRSLLDTGADIQTQDLSSADDFIISDSLHALVIVDSITPTDRQALERWLDGRAGL